MASCQDCIHSNVCLISDNKEYATLQDLKNDCPDFMHTADVVPKSEVAREIFWEIDKLLMGIYIEDEDGTNFVGVDILKYYSLKKKYTEDQT